MISSMTESQERYRQAGGMYVHVHRIIKYSRERNDVWHFDENYKIKKSLWLAIIIILRKNSLIKIFWGGGAPQ